MSGYEKRHVRLTPVKHVLNGCFGRFGALFRFFRVLLRRMVGALNVERGEGNAERSHSPQVNCIAFTWQVKFYVKFGVRTRIPLSACKVTQLGKNALRRVFLGLHNHLKFSRRFFLLLFSLTFCMKKKRNARQKHFLIYSAKPERDGDCGFT